MARVRDWRRTIAQAICGGVGSVGALTFAGWPSNAAEAAWIGLAGLVAGLAVAFAAEYLIRLHTETRRLQGIERQLEQERKQHAFETRHHQYRLAVAQRESALNAIGLKIWGGAFNEAATGHVLPLAAILARLEVETKAANLDIPIKPPEP